MKREEFLAQLEKELCGLPEDDIQKSLDFYSEMIDDRVEDGFSEEDAVSQIGDVKEIAKQILADIPITKLVKQKIKPRRRMRAWEIVLLSVGSPIWASLLIAAFAVLLSVYVSLWSVVIAVWACDAAFIGGAVGGIFASIHVWVTTQNVLTGFAVLAAAFFLAGLSILFFFVCKAATRLMIWLTKKISFCIKSCLLRKGEAQ